MNKEIGTEALKSIAEERNMSIEELKKYREYSSRSLNGKEWIEYLKLCEKAFKNTSKYLYIYEHEITQINKYINDLQQRIYKAIEDIDKLEKGIMNNTIIGFKQFIPEFERIKGDLTLGGKE